MEVKSTPIIADNALGTSLAVQGRSCDSQAGLTQPTAKGDLQLSILLPPSPNSYSYCPHNSNSVPFLFGGRVFLRQSLVRWHKLA